MPRKKIVKSLPKTELNKFALIRLIGEIQHINLEAFNNEVTVSIVINDIEIPLIKEVYDGDGIVAHSIWRIGIQKALEDAGIK